MTNEELKAAIELVQRHQDWRRGAEIEMENPKELGVSIDTVIEASRELLQLKDGTHPDMVMVPMEPTKKQLDAAVAFALNVKLHKDYGWINYTADLYKMMIAAQKGKQNEN